jgi:hypothetical protein
LGNLLNGEVIAKNRIQTEHGVFTVNCTHTHSKGDKVQLLMRPLVESIRAERSRHLHLAQVQVSALNEISGVVADVIFQQDRFKVTLDNGLYVYLDEAPKSGQKISVSVKVECLA